MSSRAATPSPRSLDAFKVELDGFLQHVLHETSVPGVAAAVSAEGTRVFASAGMLAMDCEQPLTARTEFHLGCITKLFVSIVVLELAWARILDLNVPIEVYLRELEGTVHGAQVNLAHLLSHTSGYQGTDIYEPHTLSMDWDDLVGWLRSSPQHFEPGTVYSYEHTETIVAAQIVRRVTGKDILSHVRDTLFAPLGLVPGTLGNGRRAHQAGQHILDPATRTLKQVTWSDLSGKAGTRPASMWRAAFSPHSMALDDLLGIAELIMGQSQHDSRQDRVLAPPTLNLLQRPAVALPPLVGGALAETSPATFGLGAGRWRDGFCGMGGSTYGQCQGFRFDARQGTAVAVGINVLQPYLRDLVMGRICEALAARRPGDDAPGRAAPFDLNELPGHYRGPGRGRVEVSLDDGRLALVLESGATPVKLRAELLQDPKGGFVLHCTAPQLSIGFFREADERKVGLMVGAHAYKRVERIVSDAGREPVPARSAKVPGTNRKPAE